VTPALQFDFPVAQSVQLNYLKHWRWKTSHQRVTKPHLYDDILKEELERPQGKLTAVQDEGGFVVCP
jgi:hypothetical protein